MNNYNPNIHHRRSIRLKGYDYSQAGLYFVTICCQNRDCLFGEIVNKKMILNDAGRMIEKWYLELENKFHDINLAEFVVMPNHFHCIIINTGNVNPIIETNTTVVSLVGAVGAVGADLCVCPDNETDTTGKTILDEHAGLHKSVEHILDEHRDEHILDEHRDEHILDEHRDEHVGSSLPSVIQWFKTMTTNEYIRGVKTLGWKPFDKKIWQRNYYEHIIRNETSHQRIADYIQNNPQSWANDKFYVS